MSPGFTVSAPSIANVTTSVTPNVEGSYVFPPNVKRFQVLNAGDHTVKFAWVAGQSGTDYSSLYARDAYGEDNILGASLTLYFQSAFPSQRLEVSYWT